VLYLGFVIESFQRLSLFQMSPLAAQLCVVSGLPGLAIQRARNTQNVLGKITPET